MNEISKYGVRFERLNESHLEMVRKWRNSDEVRPYMQYQNEISIEEQLDWFNKINNVNNFYFVAYIQGQPYGLYNVKDINYLTMQGEVGVFLAESSFWEGDLSIRGSFLLGFFCFKVLKLRKLTAHVLKTNKKVLNYNLQMGFKVNSNNNNQLSDFLVLLETNFNNKRNQKLMEYLEK